MSRDGTMTRVEKVQMSTMERVGWSIQGDEYSVTSTVISTVWWVQCDEHSEYSDEQIESADEYNDESSMISTVWWVQCDEYSDEYSVMSTVSVA